MWLQGPAATTTVSEWNFIGDGLDAGYTTRAFDQSRYFPVDDLGAPELGGAGQGQVESIAVQLG